MRSIDLFMGAIEDCELSDLGFSGYDYTWNNNRPEEENTQERLDTFLTSKVWSDYF